MERQKEKVVRFFDEIASDYRAAYTKSSRPSMRRDILQRRRDIVLELLGGRQGRILDVGCGPGMFADELLDRRWEVWGIDISLDMIKQAVDGLEERGGGTRGHFVQGDIEALPLPDHSFDVILCIGVLEYLNGDGGALREISRVLKPGGTIILSVPNGVSPFNLLDRGAILLARAILQTAERAIRLWNGSYRLPVQRSSLRGETPGQLCYPGKVAKDLAAQGLSGKGRVFHSYQSALISAFAPSASLALSRYLDEKLPRVFRWLGVDCVLEGAKAGSNR